MSAPRRRRSGRQSVVATVAVVLVSRPVAAHGSSATVGRGVGLPLVLAVVTGLGVAAGVVTAFRGSESATRTGSMSVGRTVGPLLVGLGAVAAGPVALEHPVTGVVGAALGLVAGAVVAAIGGCGRCGDATVGAVALHRLVEGLTLAGVAASGAAIGTVGVLVLSGHTVLECVAIAGQPARGRSEAVGAVLAVSAVFVAGAVLASQGLLTVGPVGRRWAGAVVGGLLVALGVAETGFTGTSVGSGTLRSVGDN